MNVDLRAGEEIDLLHRGNLKIIQDNKRFKFGIDAVLLSEFVNAKNDSRIMDLGTGTGIIPLLLSDRFEKVQIEALEIQKESWDMVFRSIKLNNLDDRIKVINGDIKEIKTLFTGNSYDVVTCNPPFMGTDKSVEERLDPKVIARHEVLCTLEDVIKAAAYLLKSGGSFVMIHRPFRLSEIFVSLNKYKLEPKRMRMISPKLGEEPNMVLIEAKKAAGKFLKIEPELYVYKEKGVYSEEIQGIYGRNMGS